MKPCQHKNVSQNKGYLRDVGYTHEKDEWLQIFEDNFKLIEYHQHAPGELATWWHNELFGLARLYP